jgi:hypothetical protein
VPNSLANATQPMDTTELKAVVPSAPSSAVSNPSADPEFSPISLAPIPSVMGTDTDAARQFYRSAVSQLRMPPLPAAAKIAIGASAASQVIASQVSGGSLLLKTNNVTNPVQDILNITGSGVVYGPNPGEVEILSGGSDGLTHGRAVWPGDPSSVILVDDFHANLTGIVNGSAISTGLGQLGWGLLGGSSASNAGFFGGGGLHIGSFAWLNSSTISGVGLLSLAPINTSIATAPHSPGTWALAENPGSVTTFVFKTDSDMSDSGPPAFSTAQKALYVGYTGPAFFENNQAVYSRPDVFIGVRFDTSPVIGPLTLTSAAAGTGVYAGTITNGSGNAFAGYTFVIAGFANAANNGTFLCTASSSSSLTLQNANSVLEIHAGTATRPAIGDSFYTLEVVANPTYSQVGRNNTQGVTLVTNVAPTVGGWHRLDIFFSTTGMVTVTLDGSATNTLTTAMPKITITGSITGQVGSDKGLISWSVSDLIPNSPWNDSSVVTISGFTSGRAVLNGTQTLTASLGARFTFNLVTGNVAGSSDTVTMSGYPSLTPFMMFGNDDTGTVTGGVTTPTAGTMGFFIDYFSFVQNANLGPNAPGTVVATNSRYF